MDGVCRTEGSTDGDGGESSASGEGIRRRGRGRAYLLIDLALSRGRSRLGPGRRWLGCRRRRRLAGRLLGLCLRLMSCCSCSLLLEQVVQLVGCC